MFGRKTKAIARWAAAAVLSLGLIGTATTPSVATPAPQVAPVAATAAPQVAPTSLAMSDAKSPYACGWPGMRRIWTHTAGRFRTSIYIRQYKRDVKIVCTIVSKTSKKSQKDSIGIKYGNTKEKKSTKVSYARTFSLPSGVCLKVQTRRGTTKHRKTVCYG